MARAWQLWITLLALLVLVVFDLIGLFRPDLLGGHLPGLQQPHLHGITICLILGSFLIGFVIKLIYYFFTLPDE
jgi:hypothetical protein